MARGRIFSVDVDAAQVESLAERLGRVTGTAFGLAATQAVNEVTTRFHTKALKGMTGDYGLTPSYVRSKTDVALAERNLNPRAEIVTRGDLTILGRFPLQQLTQPARKAKGDPARGISSGRKQAGIRATIKRSSPVAREKWFTMRLRAGATPGTNVGVFVRATGRANPKHIYGLSPYSMFRHQIESNVVELQDDLQRTAVQKMADVVEKVV